MPVVTDITAQKKNRDIYNLMVDGKFACGLDALQLSNLGLKIGRELTERELSDVVAQAVGSKAFNAALRYLSYRPRSTHEVEQYLKGKDYDEAVIDHTLVRLAELKYLNDAEFARSWIASRQATKPRSARVLAMELSGKRVDKDTITQVIDEVFGQAGEEEALNEVLARKLRLPKFQQDKQKLITYMMSQGYKYSDVSRAIDQLSNDEPKGST